MSIYTYIHQKEKVLLRKLRQEDLRLDNSAFQLKIQDLVSKFKNKQTTKTKGVGTQVSGSVNIFNLQYTIKRKGPP